MLSSCLKEQFGEYDVTMIGEDEIAFQIGAVATKSASEVRSEVLDIASVEVTEGKTLFLQDEVTSLDNVYAKPGTKGSPAFTENVFALYGTFNAMALKGNGDPAFVEDGTDKVTGQVFTHVEAGGNESPYIWKHNYKERIGGALPAYFFMRMPGTQPGVVQPQGEGTSLYTYYPTASGDIPAGSIKFSYQSPATATEQKDILFTSHLIDEKPEGPEKITFYHALTGVKFANFFDYSLAEGAFAKAETIIKSITISGLNNAGDCVVTPANGEGSGKNSSTAVVWTNRSGKVTFTQSIAYNFADYNKNLFPEGTLDPAASKQNLNDDDGTLTFWFIPQTLSSDVTLTVVFDVTLRSVDANGNVIAGSEETTFTNKTLNVKLADALDEEHLTWKAGELHTFTLWPTAVGVAIDDKMNEAKTEKSDVVIKNKGNTWQYVRVNLVGNWVGKYVKSSSELSDWTILMGYASQTGIEETDPWNDKDGSTTYGTFVNLVPPSTTNSPNPVNNWVRFDKYYYYTKAIGPNDAITQPIFDKYTLNTIPEFWIADVTGSRRRAQDVHLEMDLMVEAIEAPVDAEGNLIYPDGTLIPATATDGYMVVWANALGLPQVSGLDDLK